MAEKNLSAFDVLSDHLAPLAGKTVLDIGCGAGRLRALLEEAGAHWRGLEPFPPDDAPDDIDRAPAEAMPYDDATFDAAVILNALHHVPVAAMGDALHEAARVIRPGGTLVVVEPKAEGALSRVIAVVDDETEIRHAAQAAMDEAVAAGAFQQVADFGYERTERYPDFDVFRERIAAATPERAALIRARIDALRAAFETHAVRRDDRWTLAQPMAVRVLRT